MSNIKASILTVAVATLLFAGSTFAATAFAAPAAGNAPYFNDAGFTSQLQRGEVEAQAAAQLPAAGEFSAHGDVQQAASSLTRGQVEATIHGMPAAGETA